jgi:hypothetical protein
MTRSRKEKFDNRRRVDLTDTQSDWCDAKADELGISLMALIRKLITEEMQHEKSVSQNKPTDTTANSGTKSTHSNGLYTAEQVALLLDAVRKNER